MDDIGKTRRGIPEGPGGDGGAAGETLDGRDGAVPVFAYHFHVEIDDREGAVYLLGEKRQSLLTGRLYARMAPLLDGTNTVGDVVEKLRADFLEEKVREALRRMERGGFVVEACGRVPAPEAAFWSSLGLDAEEVRARLASARVMLRTFGPVEAESLIEALDSFGIGAAKGGGLTVALTDDYLREGMDALNREALAAGTPWLAVKPVGAVIWLGPLFVPGRTGCWRCLEHRLRGNREVESTVASLVAGAWPFATSRSMLPATVRTAMSMAATEIARYLAGGDSPALRGAVTTVDLATLESARHILTRRPQCADCGSPRRPPGTLPEPPVLAPQRKTFTEDGGHRICSPAVTLERCRHLVSPVTGIISEIKPVFRDGHGLVNLYYAGNQTVRNAPSSHALKVGLRMKATGKGRSDLQARASGLNEGIERYCCLYEGDEPRISASRRDLGDAAVDLEECLLASDSQYARREEWNQEHCRAGLYNFVPRRLDPDEVIEWSPAWSLTAGKHRYVPTAYCYFAYPRGPDWRQWFCTAPANGLAAGNALEEALLHGFLEVVERDCVSIWWYNRLRMPEVDLERFGDPYLTALREYYRSIGREFWVLDVTNDLGIPSFVAVSRRTDGGREEIIFGCGSHLEAKVGISRAVTEMNQFLYLIAEGRASNHAALESDQVQGRWFEAATIEKQPHLAPDPDAEPKTRESYPRMWNDDLRDDVAMCVETARRKGLDFLMVDMTRPDVGMAVVKVIVPGLRVFPARFRAGRLYNVPVEMGWRPTATAESGMNPIFLWI